MVVDKSNLDSNIIDVSWPIGIDSEVGFESNISGTVGRFERACAKTLDAHKSRSGQKSEKCRQLVADIQIFSTNQSWQRKVVILTEIESEHRKSIYRAEKIAVSVKSTSRDDGHTVYIQTF